jgi:hypothetical protein
VVPKALLLYLTAVLGFRVGQGRTLAELSPYDFVAAVAVGAIVGRIPNAHDASYLAVPRKAPARSKQQLKRAAISHMRSLSERPKLIRSIFHHRQPFALRRREVKRKGSPSHR